MASAEQKMFFQGHELGNAALVPRSAGMDEAQQLLDTGEMDETTLCWATGMGQEWLKLSELLGNAPFSALDLNTRKPLGQMVKSCNDRWQITLPESGPLSFAEEAHQLQWTSGSSASESTPPGRRKPSPPAKNSPPGHREGKRRTAPPPPPPPPEAKPAAVVAVAAATQSELEMPSKEERTKLFNRLDYNGTGGLSLAEIDKGMIEMFPSFNCKPALMGAYKAADKSGDGFIERREFRLLLHYLVYFNNLYHKFEEIDSDHDGRLSLDEFIHGCASVGVSIDRAEAEAEFARMDDNDGGYVLFDEFCTWCAMRESGAAETAADAPEEAVSGAGVNWDMLASGPGVVGVVAATPSPRPASEKVTVAAVAASPVRQTKGTPRRTAGTPPQKRTSSGGGGGGSKAGDIAESVPPRMSSSPREAPAGSPEAKSALLGVSNRSPGKGSKKGGPKKHLSRGASPTDQYDRQKAGRELAAKKERQKVELEEDRSAEQWMATDKSKKLAAKRAGRTGASDRLTKPASGYHSKQKAAERRQKALSEGQDAEEGVVLTSQQYSARLEAIRQGKDPSLLDTTATPADGVLKLEVAEAGRSSPQSGIGSPLSNRGKSPRKSPVKAAGGLQRAPGSTGSGAGLEVLISEAASKLKTLSGEVYDYNSPESRAQRASPRPSPQGRSSSDAASAAPSSPHRTSSAGGSRLERRDSIDVIDEFLEDPNGFFRARGKQPSPNKLLVVAALQDPSAAEAFAVSPVVIKPMLQLEPMEAVESIAAPEPSPNAAAAAAARAEEAQRRAAEEQADREAQEAATRQAAEQEAAARAVAEAAEAAVAAQAAATAAAAREPEPEPEPEEEEEPDPAEEAAALEKIQAGTQMKVYEIAGKYKNERVFWVDPKEARISWGKKMGAASKGARRMVEVLDGPNIPDGNEVFDEEDEDGSGSLDQSEVADLYWKQRGEKLKPKELEKAMAAMDSEGDGQVSREEFMDWWKSNGGDLELQRAKALTIRMTQEEEPHELRLVCPSASVKRMWLNGCRAAIASRNEGCQIHVRGVGGRFENRGVLTSVFAKYGEVTEAWVRRRFDSDGNNTSWALVTMANVKAASSVLASAALLPRPLTVAAYSSKQASKSKKGMRALERKQGTTQKTVSIAERIANATPDEATSLEGACTSTPHHHLISKECF